MASVGPGDALNLPWAARQQGEVTTWDYALAEYVQLRRPAARWWWGERKSDNYHGAVCYVCADKIIAWDTRWPITREAQDAIRTHGAGHVGSAVLTLASRTPARSTGDDAPPTGETP